MARTKKILTKEERKGEEAFARDKKIKDLIRIIRNAWVEVIPELQILRDYQQYIDILGDENAQFVAYLALPEVFLTRSKVTKLIDAKRNLVDFLEIPIENLRDIATEKVRMIGLHVSNKDVALDLLEKAKTLPSTDWNEEIQLFIKDMEIDDGHTHEFRKYEICKLCGEKHNIDG